MTYAERVIDWLQENGCGTTAEIAEGINFPARRLTEKLCLMRDSGLLQGSETMAVKRPSGGRPSFVWGLTRRALEDLASRKPKTRAEQVLAWLYIGNTGSTEQVAKVVGINKKQAGDALTWLEHCGLVKVLETKRPASGTGRSFYVWGWTGATHRVPERPRTGRSALRAAVPHQERAPRKRPERDDSLLPLNRTPAEVIVKTAIKRRHALDMVWGATA